MKILSMFPVMVALESQSEVDFFNKYYSDIVNLKNLTEYRNGLVLQFKEKVEIYDKKLKNRLYIKADLSKFIEIDAKYLVKIYSPVTALEITNLADELGVRIDLLPEFYVSRCKRFILSGGNVTEFKIYLENLGVEVKNVEN